MKAVFLAKPELLPQLLLLKGEPTPVVIGTVEYEEIERS